MRGLKKLILIVIAVIMAFPLTACKVTKGYTQLEDFAEGVTVSDDGKEIYAETKDGKKRLKIAFTDAGFGSDWLRVISTHFVKENPEYWIYLDGDPSLTASVGVQLNSGRNLSDIYMPLAHDWQTYALNGLLEDLSDVYSAVADPDKEVPEGEEPVTIYDKMLPMWQEYCYASNGTEKKMYGYPWSLGVTGIAYNGTMFEQHGWEVPETVAELLELCEKIKGAGKAPFVYPGSSGGYFDFMGMAFWMQASGIDGFKKFMSFPDAEVFNPAKEPSKGKQAALEAFASIFNENNKNALTGSMSKSPLEAQMSFLREEAAMIINGSWIETETKEDTPEGFNMRYMPFPYIDGALKDETTGEVKKINYATSPDLMLIPKEAPEVEGAKEFLKFISRDDMLCFFTKYTSSLRPFTYSNDGIADSMTDFAKDVIHIAETAESYFPIRTGPNENKMKLGVWSGIPQPYNQLIMNQDTPKRICLTQYQMAKEEWSRWTE